MSEWVSECEQIGQQIFTLPSESICHIPAIYIHIYIYEKYGSLVFSISFGFLPANGISICYIYSRERHFIFSSRHSGRNICSSTTDIDILIFRAVMLVARSPFMCCELFLWVCSVLIQFAQHISCKFICKQKWRCLVKDQTNAV